LKRKYCHTLIKIAIFVLLATNLKAQDDEFSQIHAAHLYINPAMTGLSYAPTLVLNYRDRWSDYSNGFKTYAVSYDQHFAPINSGLGISLVGNSAINGILKENQINLSYSYFLNISKKWGFTFGLQTAFVQKSLNFSKIFFLDQIDPTLGPNPEGIPTLENLSFVKDNLNYFDFGGGLLLFSNQFYFGTSFKHITRPDISHSDFATENRIPIKASIQLGNSYNLNISSKNVSYIAPNIFYSTQSNFHQIVAGSQLKYDNFLTGLWLRHTINNFDALIVLLGYQKSIFTIAYSYDYSFGQLSNFNANTHEISLKIDFLDDVNKARNRNRKGKINCPDVLK